MCSHLILFLLKINSVVRFIELTIILMKIVYKIKTLNVDTYSHIVLNQLVFLIMD